MKSNNADCPVCHGTGVRDGETCGCSKKPPSLKPEWNPIYDKGKPDCLICGGTGYYGVAGAECECRRRI
jgi:hypothetical protein